MQAFAYWCIYMQNNMQNMSDYLQAQYPICRIVQRPYFAYWSYICTPDFADALTKPRADIGACIPLIYSDDIINPTSPLKAVQGLVYNTKSESIVFDFDAYSDIYMDFNGSLGYFQ